MTCDRFRSAVIAAESPGRAIDADGGLSGHRERCRDCGAWFDAFVEGARVWDQDPARPPLDEAVLARTLGSPCDRAQHALAAAWDERLEAPAAARVAAHLAGCEECRLVEALLTATRSGLADLAEADPGPAFAAAVFARTSRRPPRRTWADRARAVGRGWLARPRFAWEAAYVLTLCWLLVFGNPIATFDWTTARVGAVAERDLPAPVQSAGARVQAWRDRLSLELSQVVSAVPDPRALAAGTAAGLQARAAAWTERVAAAVWGWLTSAWQDVADWLVGLFVAPLPAATEPAPQPVRSSK